MAPKIVLFAGNATFCQAEGMDVITVNSFEQYRSATRDKKIDLVVIDCHLEHNLEPMIQKIRGLRQTPVLILHSSARAGGNPADPLEAARRFMDENFRRQLQLSEIAARAGISAGYFCRRFRDAYCITPIMYLRNLRIAHACHLLINTDLPLANVTEQSGFFSISYFCREFHKEKGLSPIQFRRKNRGET